MSTEFPSAPVPAWWNLVTLKELQASVHVVDLTLEELADVGEDVESLARALAIQDLCYDQGLVLKRLEWFSDQYRELFREADLNVIQVWLERGAVLTRVFGTALVLLEKQDDFAYVPVFREALMRLHLLRAEFNKKVFAKGTGAPMVAPSRPRIRWKV